MSTDADLIREYFRRIRRRHRVPDGGPRSSQQAVAHYYHLVSDMTERLLSRPHHELRGTLSALCSQERSFVTGIAMSAASRAVREKDVRRLEVGIQGLLLASFIQDDREVLMDLALLNHSATKLGVRLEPMLRSACADFSKAVSSRFVDLVDSFYERPTRVLSDFASVEGVDQDGEFTYVRAWDADRTDVGGNRVRVERISQWCLGLTAAGGRLQAADRETCGDAGRADEWRCGRRQAEFRAAVDDSTKRKPHLSATGLEMLCDVLAFWPTSVGSAVSRG